MAEHDWGEWLANNLYALLDAAERTSADQDAVRGECADVGNFALMVADRFGAL